MNTNSIIHQRLKGLLEVKMGEHYHYEVPAGTGLHSVAALRVYLSRVRKILSEAGRQVNHFKVIVVSVEKSKEDEMYEIVTLMRTSGTFEIQQDVAELVALFNTAGALPGSHQ